MEKTNDILKLLVSQSIDIEQIINSYNDSTSKKLPWLSVYNDIQLQVFPNYRNYANGSAISSASQPNKGNIGSQCGEIAGKIHKVSSMLMSHTCDPSVKWLYAEHGVRHLNSIKAATDWINSCVEELYFLFSDPYSNFYPSTTPLYLDWFSIGTACRHVYLKESDNQIKYDCISMQDISCDISGYNEITTVYRTFNLTTKQAYDLWGNSLHLSQLQELQNKVNQGCGKTNKYVEVCTPNPLVGKIPTLSVVKYVIDIQNKFLIDVGVSHDLPYIVSRFFVSPGETYGRSYVWYAMPDIKTTNKLSKLMLLGAEYSMLPMILTKDTTTANRNNMAPGAMIQGLDMNGNATMRPMSLGGDVGMTSNLFYKKLQSLDEALIVNDIFPQFEKNMTATEINKREILAANRIRPLIVRLESEDLNKVVIRSLHLLNQIGKLPPFPYEELGILPEQMPDPISQLKIRFTGQMARMQKLQELMDLDNFINDIGKVSQFDSEAVDWLDSDDYIKKSGNLRCISHSTIRGDEQVADIRRRRRESQAQQASQVAAQQEFERIVRMKEVGFDAREF